MDTNNKYSWKVKLFLVSLVISSLFIVLDLLNRYETKRAREAKILHYGICYWMTEYTDKYEMQVWRRRECGESYSFFGGLQHSGYPCTLDSLGAVYEATFREWADEHGSPELKEVMRTK